MSSGFVSGGTADAPVKRDQEWLQAQADLEAARLAKAQAAVQAASGRGLFETLQANKGIPTLSSPSNLTSTTRAKADHVVLA